MLFYFLNVHKIAIFKLKSIEKSNTERVQKSHINNIRFILLQFSRFRFTSLGRNNIIIYRVEIFENEIFTLPLYHISMGNLTLPTRNILTYFELSFEYIIYAQEILFNV